MGLRFWGGAVVGGIQRGLGVLGLGCEVDMAYFFRVTHVCEVPLPFICGPVFMVVGVWCRVRRHSKEVF